MSDELEFSRDTSVTDEHAVRILEEKIRTMQMEAESLRKELNYYKSEMEKLLSPPLIEAIVLDILEDGRVVVKSTSGPNLVVNVSGTVDFSSIKVGKYVALNQRGSAVVEVLRDRDDPLVRSMEVVERPNVRYQDIGGLDQQIQEVREVVELPLKKPELFKELGITPPKGILLYGPPGTGKTMLAKAVASESNASFIHVVASEFAQKFVGEGARVVRDVFELARKKAPSIVFIDEIDAIGAKRIDLGTSGEREVQRTLMQLLAEIDGFQPLDNVKIIAATNRIDILDPALLRPGRFDRLIEISLPNVDGRKQILRIYLQKMKVDNSVNVDELAMMTEGFSGADLKNLCTEAGYIAIRNDSNVINMAHFRSAIERLRSKKLSKEVVDRGEKYV
ncbi:Proteasome-activating nucleotidase [Metallosphaera sp. J1]|uniref:proteasome-activating nucleotidase n=1 Tax=Metallosphaera javensis (ex Hofmann et al. 2022) TaxID=99938 RepID=UPI001EE14E67|nr:proteasome-activating nucleotidase [Metallosphaera javensis (ex Hofmann et al. 2022)]MCG3107885.1 Proteasome-activating nucleotidase [Metallosphaera javensis (ex Hofmann et al. 2022)]